MKNLRPVAFWIPVILFISACAYNFVDQEGFVKVINNANAWLMGNFAWAFCLGVLVMLGVVIFLMFSKFGDVRIGGRNAAPMFDDVRYFSIVLTSIIAIGILFWATSEPLYHMTAPPESLNIQPNSPDAVVFAMSTLFIHWGFLPLAIYAIPSIMFAFAFYNMRKPYTLGSMLTPVFGDKVLGKWSQGIDAVCMYSLIAGMSASLGTGILSIAGGLKYLTKIQTGAFLWAMVDIAIVATFVISSITGLFNGIKKLSEINFVVFIFLAIFVFVFGPTFFMLNLGVEAFANHLQTFFQKAAFTGAAAGDPWAGWWTIFYWCNWLAWAPISGMFLGRISYGQTIRKAVMVIFVLPALFDILWMVIFGGAAIRMELDGGMLSQAMAAGPEFAVYALLDKYPVVEITIPIFIICMFLSYVTGSDAYTTTLGGMSTTGISPKSPEPSAKIKIFWGAIIGTVSWIMITSSGIDGVKMLSNLGGGPALVLELLICISLVKVALNPKTYDTFKNDYTEDGTPIKSVTKKAIMSEEAVIDVIMSETNDS
ncbi:BCCT transporter [Clostridium thermosuccinogenes]|jgi:choline-glycine betaine transporter|uniref:BCCT transporter n=1 Tax=Clostridium thermosuccinogenes TaxID=84032 RepID=A0A2K2F7F2_9CLOT|nr:BCCT family transporter [Pseudoclostridium thermosuccinogenes]AUS94983.1 BCCT transporter [Pseudoclostridium thermosuccinogenes]PNT94705.1 BCCT transporter [Pseudoclostridium thermosuccinogenes]PNT95243.1 BCCT transporter [Pseudoclostridium thermosuccinogenes]